MAESTLNPWKRQHVAVLVAPIAVPIVEAAEENGTTNQTKRSKAIQHFDTIRIICLCSVSTISMYSFFVISVLFHYLFIIKKNYNGEEDTERADGRQRPKLN